MGLPSTANASFKDSLPNLPIDNSFISGPVTGITDSNNPNQTTYNF
jgi:hypothetical protein